MRSASSTPNPGASACAADTALDTDRLAVRHHRRAGRGVAEPRAVPGLGDAQPARAVVVGLAGIAGRAGGGGEAAEREHAAAEVDRVAAPAGGAPLALVGG